MSIPYLAFIYVLEYVITDVFGIIFYHGKYFRGVFDELSSCYISHFFTDFFTDEPNIFPDDFLLSFMGVSSSESRNSDIFYFLLFYF